MLTRIDHIMICVPDLQQAIVTYTRLGFRVHPGGVHPGQGTHNAIAFHQDDYLELLARSIRPSRSWPVRASSTSSPPAAGSAT